MRGGTLGYRIPLAPRLGRPRKRISALRSERWQKRNDRMRLGLLTTLATNIGDDFIRDGLLHVVRELLPECGLEYVAVCKHEPHSVYPLWHPLRAVGNNSFCHRTIPGRVRGLAEDVLPSFGFSRFDACDLILQCGTPVIWDGCRNSEWGRLIWHDVLARLGGSGKPILNVGGGSCYPWTRQPTTLVGNADEPFARLMLDACQLTTVRDRLARDMFASLGYQAQHFCCPAMLVGKTLVDPARPSRKVAINYMHGGGHYGYGQEIDAGAWENTLRQMIAKIQTVGWQPIFLAHNEAELKLAAQTWPELPRSHPASQREYFNLIRDAAFGIFNRMHAAVAAAGLGIPSVSIGTDTRNLMVETLGLPVFYVKEATVDNISAAVDSLLLNRDRESERLLALRDVTRENYKKCLRPFLAPFGRST